MKKRIDRLLVDRGLADSREKAQALIMAGNVLVDDAPAWKAGLPVSEDADIRLREAPHPYVSRGGIKLEAPLKLLVFAFRVRSASILDHPREALLIICSCMRPSACMRWMWT